MLSSASSLSCQDSNGSFSVERAKTSVSEQQFQAAGTAGSATVSRFAAVRLQPNRHRIPTAICGIKDAARHTSTAAVASPVFTPIAVRSVIMNASTVPSPPGVIGIISPICATANPPKATSRGVTSVSPSTPRRAAKKMRNCISETPTCARVIFHQRVRTRSTVSLRNLRI